MQMLRKSIQAMHTHVACEFDLVRIREADERIPNLGLYTDESPGLKVDPVVVLVLSLGFIFSVVALHSMSFRPLAAFAGNALLLDLKCADASNHSHRQNYSKIFIIGRLALSESWLLRQDVVPCTMICVHP